jgi:hypothetical protein
MRSRTVGEWRSGGTRMHIIFAFLLTIGAFLLPSNSYAESSDVEGVIEGVDEDHLTLTLNDGRKYQATKQFSFDGLEKGVKVAMFYTDTDGKRVINDLQIMQ